MIVGLLSLLGLTGVPAILLGIAGKLGLSWLTGLMGGSGLIATILKPLVSLSMGLVDVLIMVLKWLLQKVLKGLDVIIGSPSAVIAVLLLMYSSYAYGKYVVPKPSSVRVEAPAKPGKSTRRVSAPTPSKKPSKSWIENVLGN